LIDHRISCDFGCLFDCGHPNAASLAAISAHMRHCPGRLAAMHALLPHRATAYEDSYYRLQSAIPSLELFRLALTKDISALPDSDFKRVASDFLNGEANLNILLFELEKLLPS